MIFKKKDITTGEIILKCPRDRTEMTKLVKEDVILDVCPKCKGMWLDHEEIDKLQGLASQRLKTNTDTTNTNYKHKHGKTKKA